MSAEDDENEINKAKEGAWAATGFAIVLVMVGLPVWWRTTTVYRAALPCSEIDNLATQFNYHTIHVQVRGEASVKYAEQMKNLDNSKGEIRFLVSSWDLQKHEKEFIAKSPSLENLENDLMVNGSPASYIYLYILPDSHDLLGAAEAVVGRQRTIFTKATTDHNKIWKLIHSMAVDPLAKVHFNDNYMQAFLPESKIPRTALMRQVPTEPGYDITLTLMLPEPQNVIAQWDPEAAVRDYLSPLVKQVKSIAELNVRSQVLYMTSLNVYPKWNEDNQHYTLPENQLPLTINAIEAKLGSFVSTRPSLHFIVYVPGQNQSPLQIYNADEEPLKTNSFLVPRWGGVMIHNSPWPLNSSDLPQVFPLDTHWIMTTVVTHLHKLLPIPAVNMNSQEDGIRKLPPKDSRLSDWQLDGLARARVSDYLNNIKTTLQSLCELVDEIDNMVVSDEVAEWVWGATVEWRECRDASREGRLIEATLYCTQAFISADAAFFHPSMLALLYFPDNQKYAIYVPLFLPVSIPVVLSLRMIGKLLRRKPDKDKVD